MTNKSENYKTLSFRYISSKPETFKMFFFFKKIKLSKCFI